MKHPKEYAILAVIILALGLYLFLRDTDRTTYTLPDLATIATQDFKEGMDALLAKREPRFEGR